MTEPKYIDAVKIHKDLTRTIIDDINNPTKNTVFDFGWRQGVRYAAFVIENEPAADVVERPKEADYTVENALKQKAERRGRWTTERTMEHDGEWYCSVCGYEPTVYEASNYCPNCGAKMDDNWEEPAINPCRGCEDYDGRRGCISKGGCGAKMEDEEE